MSQCDQQQQHQWGGGRVSRGDQSYVIGSRIDPHVSEIGSIVVTQAGGAPVLVRDLGRHHARHRSVKAFWARTGIRMPSKESC